jgi:DNA-binding LacI/PurR family transcriptional regulator
MSPATRKRIQATMKKLGYRPNLVARGLVSSKTRVIAAIVPDFNPHVVPIFRGVADECRRNEYALMVFSTEYWTLEAASYLSIVDNWQVDGVIIYNVVQQATPSKEELAMLKRGAPSVFVNKYLRAKSVDTVSVDNYDAVLTAIDHLYRLGHRRIGALHGSLMSVDGVERRDGYRKAMNARSLTYDKSICGVANFSDGEAFEEMRRILRSPNPPTAMFCANDLMALAACRAIESEGLKVPDDISLVGFDDIVACHFHRPSLTTLRPPLRDIGHKALELLIARIQDPGKRREQIALKAELIVRDSTGPCRGQAPAQLRPSSETSTKKYASLQEC